MTHRERLERMRDDLDDAVTEWLEQEEWTYASDFKQDRDAVQWALDEIDRLTAERGTNVPDR